MRRRTGQEGGAPREPGAPTAPAREEGTPSGPPAGSSTYRPAGSRPAPRAPGPARAPELEPAPAPEPAPGSAPGSDAGPAPAPAQRPPGRSALTSLHPSRARLLAAFLCLLLGLAVAVQVRQHTGSDLAGLRQSELLGLLSDATDRSDRLQREIDALQRQRDELRTSGDAQAAARALAQQRVDTLGILAGTLPATGPGITMRIELPSTLAADTLHRSSILLDAVEELRDAGAEAIQVDGVRVVAGTAFTDTADGGVSIGGARQRSPYSFTAIGDAQTLASAMDFPDGVVATVTRAGGSARVAQAASVDVTALQSAKAPAYARPVTPSDSSTP